MRGLLLACLAPLALLDVAWSVPQAASVASGDAAGSAFYEQNIRPLFAQHCYACHSSRAASLQGGLALDTPECWRRGATSGPILVAGDPDKSPLIQAVRHASGVTAMPLGGGKLSEREIAALVEWVRRGAPGPREEKSAPGAGKRRIDIAAGRTYWAFQPLRRVSPPSVKNTHWPRTPIDRFILAQMEKNGVRPNPAADRRTLIRRATFDLIGLPPTPEEVEAFVHDTRPDAYPRLLDRLLASPHYGERWGRHWLDLARFAESHGYEQDYDRPYAYTYRDFVIRALNADLPYDTFVRWQLAGDEIDPDNPMALMATGFLAAGTHATQITKNQVEKERYDELDDMLATTGTSLLSLTVGCARCHDHKYDPIPNRDYYRMLSTFTTTVRSDYDVDLEPAEDRLAYAAFAREHAPLVEALDRYEKEQLPQRMDAWLRSGAWKAAPARPARPKEIDAILASVAAGQPLTEPARSQLLAWYRTIDPGWQAREKQIQADLARAPKLHLQKALISSEGVPAVRTNTQGGDFLEVTNFLKRGDPSQKEGVATQSFLQVLMRTPNGERHWQEAPPKGWHTSYRRRALAGWITDTRCGAGMLLARVIVNRLWQHHLGRGIVATPSDFGTQGARPSHPELLDWLATELIRNGWRLKPIHKLIMNSAVYLQSSAPNPRNAQRDRENRLFWQHPRQRLEAEAIRDAMLAVSGELDPTMFGPGTLDEGMKRRSIYFFIKRSHLIPILTVFDAPNALQSIPARQTTTIAPQALLLMNSPYVRDYARHFAERIAPKAGEPNEAAIRSCYLLALSRPPTQKELAASLAFLAQQAASYRAAGHADADTLALTDFCQVLLGLNEFVYVE
ncbi:MAG TPA: DUF1549 domain-containing protein [Chthonomonadaceae bacterium]|nr:DUF1549 domain-containing protein [Chthonomonadaceae bacterium]